MMVPLHIPHPWTENHHNRSTYRPHHHHRSIYRPIITVPPIVSAPSSLFALIFTVRPIAPTSPFHRSPLPLSSISSPLPPVAYIVTALPLAPINAPIITHPQHQFSEWSVCDTYVSHPVWPQQLQLLCCCRLSLTKPQRWPRLHSIAYYIDARSRPQFVDLRLLLSAAAVSCCCPLSSSALMCSTNLHTLDTTSRLRINI